ncbi:MAG: hypothetical protein MI743_11890 [Sneathiellales bacterium]|nr:hypothetical protein [Sneathiellales bacterium]
MPAFRHNIKQTPSAPAGGVTPGRKLTLRAANDNRPPLNKIIGKILYLGLPIAALFFFGIAWYLG